MIASYPLTHILKGLFAPLVREEGEGPAVDVADPRHSDHEALQLILEDPVLDAQDVELVDLEFAPRHRDVSGAAFSGATPDQVRQG